MSSTDLAGERTIEISASLTVRQVTQLGDQLRAAIASSSCLMLDISDVSDADLSFVQLVESARLLAERSGGRLRLTRPASGGLLSVLERGGFLNPTFPERTAFWTGTETCR